MENELKNSIQYINNKVSKKPGFSAPTNYFETLEDSIESRLVEEKFAKNSGFKTQENYFDGIENSILAKILSEEKETKVISFKQRIFKLIPIAAAASIILFIGLNSFIYNTSDKLTLDSLSNNDIEYWLDTNTFNSIDVTVVYEDDILEENDFLFTEIKDESIEDYINSIDNTSLLNELN